MGGLGGSGCWGWLVGKVVIERVVIRGGGCWGGSYWKGRSEVWLAAVLKLHVQLKLLSVRIAFEYVQDLRVVWCGMVWCGVVWNGVVWCGVEWCGVEWCGVVWCGVV